MIEPKMLAYLDATDKDAVDDWARQHYEWHSAIFNSSRKQGYPNFSTYPILRDMLSDLAGWAEFHNREHQEIAAALGFGATVDLSEIDPSDKLSTDTWLEVHSEIHIDLRAALGII